MTTPSPAPSPVSLEIPRAARVLGYAGLIPFLVGAVAVWVAPIGPVNWLALAMRGLMLYAVVILAFMGAVHWGLAMADMGAAPGQGSSYRRLGGSVIPPLLAWFATFLAAAPALVLLMLSFAGLFFADLRAARAGLAPAWYPRLRRPLTAIVVVCLGSALLRIATAPT